MKHLKKYNRKNNLAYIQTTPIKWEVPDLAEESDMPVVMAGRSRESKGEKLWAINQDDLSIYFITEHHLRQQTVYQPALVHFQLTVDTHFSVSPIL